MDSNMLMIIGGAISISISMVFSLIKLSKSVKKDNADRTKELVQATKEGFLQIITDIKEKANLEKRIELLETRYNDSCKESQRDYEELQDWLEKLNNRFDGHIEKGT